MHQQSLQFILERAHHSGWPIVGGARDHSRHKGIRRFPPLLSLLCQSLHHSLCSLLYPWSDIRSVVLSNHRPPSNRERWTSTMPVPTLPPTPAASLDITGKASASHAPTISLGPAAVNESLSERSHSATPSGNDSESSYHPASPISPNATRRKSSSKSTKPGDDFVLPPPPSRSRKIIQMKPKPDSAIESATQRQGTEVEAQPAPSKASKKRASNSGTTAAGRKIARKTAHSLIERRRRSKMNEEFGVLKDMIPACRGHEMHKLAILQVRSHPCNFCVQPADTPPLRQA